MEPMHFHHFHLLPNAFPYIGGNTCKGGNAAETDQ